MANRAVLACVDDVLRLCMSNEEEIFGGKIMLLLGDFKQTCPVVPHGSKEDILQASIRSFSLWSSLRIFHLTEPIRNAVDPDFSDFVESIGIGTNGSRVDLSIIGAKQTADELIDFVYPSEILDDPVTCALRSVLAPTNIQVDNYNAKIMKRLPGDIHTCWASDTLKNLEEDSDAVEDAEPSSILDYIAKHTPPGCPPYALHMKEGAVYRLMRNISIERALVKNARVVARHIGQRVITVRLIRDGLEGCEDFLIPRICFEYTNPIHRQTILRRQFPLAPAYSTTFNSCQGLTLDKIGVDLTRPVFSHGQLYTALSRIRRREDCAVLLPDDSFTTNVVFSELLV
jgi:ATP-dependent DNA helicase PIF1